MENIAGQNSIILYTIDFDNSQISKHSNMVVMDQPPPFESEKLNSTIGYSCYIVYDTTEYQQKILKLLGIKYHRVVKCTVSKIKGSFAQVLLIYE